jgi:hypothetical protein
MIFGSWVTSSLQSVLLETRTQQPCTPTISFVYWVQIQKQSIQNLETLRIDPFKPIETSPEIAEILFLIFYFLFCLYSHCYFLNTVSHHVSIEWLKKTILTSSIQFPPSSSKPSSTLIRMIRSIQFADHVSFQLSHT